MAHANQGRQADRRPIGGRSRSLTAVLVAGALVVTSGLALVGPVEPARAAVEAVNPVTLDRRANSGFLVIADGDVTVGPGVDESEGTMAAAGTVRFRQPYNVGAGATPPPTFRSPGDERDTYLYAGGGVDWAGSTSVLNIANGGYTKLGGSPTAWTVLQENPNSYQVVPAGVTDPTATPRIGSDTVPQTAASVADLRGAPDIAGAFAAYRPLSRAIAACPATEALYSAPTATSPTVPRPVTSPTPQVYVDLVPGRTNFLRFTPSELANISQIGLLDGQALSASTPLVITVTGTTFSGTLPRQGWPEAASPYVLWNFPEATAVAVVGNTAELNGSLYAPNAAVTWAQTQNLSGNVVAASFIHGSDQGPGAPREIHDHAFAAQVACADAAASTLTLRKAVEGSDEPPSSWTLTATSSDGDTTVTGRSGAVEAVSVAPGEYRLSESGPPRFRSEGWACTDGEAVVPVSDAGVVTVPEDADVVCVVTNVAEGVTATGTLTLRKDVVGAPAGTAPPTDWVLTATGATETVTGRSGDEAVTARAVPAGTYTLREDGPTEGFRSDGWDCGDAVVSDGDAVTVAAGDDTTCVVTNTWLVDPNPTPSPVPTNTPTASAAPAGGGAGPTGWAWDDQTGSGGLAFTGPAHLLAGVVLGAVALLTGIALATWQAVRRRRPGRG